MEYSIYMILDKTIEHDYCILEGESFDGQVIRLNVFTNGKEPINFKEIVYLAYEEAFLTRFSSYFSNGRKVVNNAKTIHVEKKLESDAEKNSAEDNEEIIKLLELNNLMQKKIFISVGDISLNAKDIKLLEPLKKCRFSTVTFDESGLFHTIEELNLIYGLINFVEKKIKEQDFSEIEKVLYAYDIIRTNFMVYKECEEIMERVLDFYTEPSFCYSLIFNETLKRLNINSKFALGDFNTESKRAFNIAYINDDIYNINGVYYFDIANNSKQKFENSISKVKNDSIGNSLINNYAFFAKAKGDFIERGFLFEDYAFGDFDDTFMMDFNDALEGFGIKGVYDLRSQINPVGYFIDGRTVIDSFNGIRDQDELEEIKEATERYASLFGADISGEDFLEILFNVRKVEYKENKELFPLSIEELKTTLFNSNFALSNMVSEFSDEKEYEQEDIDKVLQDTFEYSFEEAIDNTKMEERIRNLKLTLNMENKPKNDDNN